MQPLILFTIGSIAQAVGPDEVTTKFKMTIIAKNQIQVMDEQLNIDAETELRYTWRRDGTTRTLSYDSSATKVKTNDEIIEMIANRKKYMSVQPGKEKVDFTYEGAPPRLQAMLSASYETPLYEVTVDREGRVYGQKRVARPEAEQFTGQDAIVNALLFHPPFSARRNTWRSPTKVTMGDGQYGEGQLVYEKVSQADGKQVVKVSGELTNDDPKEIAPGAQIGKTRYVVSGEQTYDLARKEWVKGKLVLDTKQELRVAGKPSGTIGGTMTLTHEMLPEKGGN